MTSPTLKKRFSNGFTMCSNEIINNEALSLKAKGLYLLLISKPDNWAFRQDLLIQQSKDSEYSFVSGIKELLSARYLKRTRLKVGSKLSHYAYEVFDIPYTEFPSLGIQDLEIPSLTNTDSSNTESLKREESIFNLSKMMFINIFRSNRFAKDGSAIKIPYDNNQLIAVDDNDLLYDTYTLKTLSAVEAKEFYSRLYAKRVAVIDYIEANTNYRFGE